LCPESPQAILDFADIILIVRRFAFLSINHSNSFVM